MVQGTRAFEQPASSTTKISAYPGEDRQPKQTGAGRESRACSWPSHEKPRCSFTTESDERKGGGRKVIGRSAITGFNVPLLSRYSCSNGGAWTCKHWGWFARLVRELLLELLVIAFAVLSTPKYPVLFHLSFVGELLRERD